MVFIPAMHFLFKTSGTLDFFPKFIIFSMYSKRKYQSFLQFLCITHSLPFLDTSISKLWETVKEREAWHAAVHGVAKCWTQIREWTNKKKCVHLDMVPWLFQSRTVLCFFFACFFFFFFFILFIFFCTP